MSNTLITTFSIVGRDPKNGDLGVAVQSKFFAVGAIVPWAKVGVGAVATQSWTNTTYGFKGWNFWKTASPPNKRWIS